MPGQPARYNAPDSNEAVVHDLPPIRFDGQLIAIRLQVRRSEDGIWRGRVLFGAPDTEAERSTAAIFCAASEPDLWQAVRDLRHDLSNPLAAILAETQLLLLGADKYDAETVAGLKQIEALSRKMRGSR